jgi:hypothetical protein
MAKDSPYDAQGRYAECVLLLLYSFAKLTHPTGLPDIVKQLGDNFAILASYSEELSSVRSADDLYQLEGRIEAMFQPREE